MKTGERSKEKGSTIICVLATILILSLIGANVMLNCTTQYNAVAKQVDGWKLALSAAEAGGDIAYSEVRKIALNGTLFASAGWGTPAASPAPTPCSAPSPAPTPGGSWDYTLSPFGPGNSLSAKVTVDNFTNVASPGNQPIPVYRIRSVGTARVFGLRRTGMNDAMVAGLSNFSSSGAPRGDGDSLLRKIDFNYRHFLTTYGNGDKNFNNIASYNVAADASGNPLAEVSRRIELIAVPQMLSFTGSLRVGNSFDGPGSAGVVDSYDSRNGPYTFVANNPASPYYADSRNGDVSVGTASFAEGGPIYGNVTTNGGNVTHSATSISGTIDNAVPFTIPPLVKPAYPTGFILGVGTTPTITPARAVGTPGSPNFYVYSGLTSLTINAVGGAETYVTVVVNGDVGPITINNHVNAKIYFTGNLSAKANELVNNNVDNAVPTNSSRAGHMQIYGVSPTNGSTQTIAIAPPGSIAATIYAPSADISLTGNPDWYGAIVARSFSGNGNTGFHYDKAIAGEGALTDYRVASYIEDVR